MVNYEEMFGRLKQAAPVVREASFATGRAVECDSETTELTETVLGLLDRHASWLSSAVKLDAVEDWQAHAAASRATIEIATDLGLLHLDGNDAVRKMIAWEESAHLKVAEANVRADHQVQIFQGFISGNGARIRALRATHWPKKTGEGRHPDRWTGRTLTGDADRVGKEVPELSRLLPALRHYTVLNWQVHGSGLAITRRKRGALPLLVCQALLASGQLSFETLGLALKMTGTEAVTAAGVGAASIRWGNLVMGRAS